MKLYYFYLNEQQAGPYTFEELKNKNLTRESLIWSEGFSEWRKADTLIELQELFRSIPPPPPSQNIFTPPALPNINNARLNEQNFQPEHNYEARKILGIKRNFFLYGVLAVIIIISVSAFSNYQADQNSRTHQLEMRLAEQERIARESKMLELNKQLQAAYENLEIAKRELNNASAFKLLRSADARHEQVSTAENQVKIWENNIDELKEEMNRLNPDWDN